MLRPVGVLPSVAGRERVPVDELKRKLGDAAWYVLLAMWTCRAKTGHTHVTNAGIAKARGFAEQHPRAVRKACARLKSAGLIRIVGWRKMRVARGRATAELEVFVRVVLGAPAEGTLGAPSSVFVPSPTVAWLEKARSHGGYRHGRRGGSQEGPTSSQEGPTPRAPSGVKRGPRYPILPDPGFRDPYCLASLGNAAAIGEAAVVSDPRQAGAARTPSFVTPTPVTQLPAREGALLALSDPPTPEPSPGPTGSRYGAALTPVGVRRPRPPLLPTTHLPGLPPPPWALVGIAKVPPPPLLDAEMPNRERAIRLADAYRGAARARFGKRAAFAFRRGDISDSKFYRTLVAAAEFMLENSIAPAAWAAWSCDIWKIYGDGKKPPPVAWVFGVKRLGERRGWFEAEEGAYDGGRVKYGAAQTALVQGYLRARYAIDAGGAWAAPVEIFERFFPGESYEIAVTAARAEVARTKADLRRDADMGEFLW